jgi:GT2 family glycosyltransferase
MLQDCETLPVGHISSGPFPDALDLEPISRRPLRLSAATLEAVLARPAPAGNEMDMRVATRSTESFASIIVVTFNKLVFTRLCLEGLLAHTPRDDYELIVVDNGSLDGTLEYVLELARWNSQIRVLSMGRNTGFAAANNRGLGASKGNVLVLLNNDTLLPPGWLARITQHLGQTEIGLLGAVTNRAGNEGQVEVPYRTFGEFLRFASRCQAEQSGRLFDIRTATMFCVGMRRDVYRAVGPLDETFGLGLFEDDDYSVRVREADFRVVCAEDVFVHHFGQASFGELVPSGEYAELFRRNRARFEEKWGLTWNGHQHRHGESYESLRRQIREVVHTLLPWGARIIVMSKGDENLVNLSGVTGWHFPQTQDGTYAGYYPGTSQEAISHLEMLRTRGGEYLLVPRTSFWWLERYPEFGAHLREKYRKIREDDSCVIFTLSSGVIR